MTIGYGFKFQHCNLSFCVLFKWASIASSWSSNNHSWSKKQKNHSW